MMGPCCVWIRPATVHNCMSRMDCSPPSPVMSALLKVKLRTSTSVPLTPLFAPPSMSEPFGRERLYWLMEYWILQELMEMVAPFTVNDREVDGVVV